MDTGGLSLVAPMPATSFISIDILTPALCYPTSLSRSEIIASCQRDLSLNTDDCSFFDIDNTRIACLLKNSKFSMDFVEKTFHHCSALGDQLMRAGEALKTFQEKMEQDQELIATLKKSIEEMKVEAVSSPRSPLSNTEDTQSENEYSWKSRYEEEAAVRRSLQEKLYHHLKQAHFNVDVKGDGDNNAEVPEKPKVIVPKLLLNFASTSMKPSAPLSPTMSLRSRSATDISFDEKDKVVVLVVENESLNANGHMEDTRLLKRRNTIPHFKSPEHQPFIEPPPQDTLSSCRLCSCEVFRHGSKAGWICHCGHTNIKHSKISPRTAPGSPNYS